MSRVDFPSVRPPDPPKKEAAQQGPPHAWLCLCDLAGLTPDW